MSLSRRSVLVAASVLPLAACSGWPPRLPSCRADTPWQPFCSPPNPAHEFAAALAAQGYLASDPATVSREVLADGVVAFQKANGLPPSGEVDERTKEAIAAAPPRSASTRTGLVLEIEAGRGLLKRVADGTVTHTLNAVCPSRGPTQLGDRTVLSGLPAGTFRLRVTPASQWVFLPPIGLVGVPAAYAAADSPLGVSVNAVELAALVARRLVVTGLALVVRP